MSVTRSYNKRTNTTYAYETTYVWSEEKQRKVQQRKCIGKVDPQTDEIIPNGRRGRPQGKRNAENKASHSSSRDNTTYRSDQKVRQSLELITEKCADIERCIEEYSSSLASSLSELRKKLNTIWKDCDS